MIFSKMQSVFAILALVSPLALAENAPEPEGFNKGTYKAFEAVGGTGEYWEERAGYALTAEGITGTEIPGCIHNALNPYAVGNCRQTCVDTAGCVGILVTTARTAMLSAGPVVPSNEDNPVLHLLSTSVAGAQECVSAKAGQLGFPYNDGSRGSYEHGSNGQSSGCMDKLESYKDADVDFQVDNMMYQGRNVDVAPECFRTCPPADANGNAAPCGKSVWETAEDAMVDRFTQFKNAYNVYDAQHGTSKTANSTYAAAVATRSNAETTLHSTMIVLLTSQDEDDLYDPNSTDGLNSANAKVQALQTAEQNFQNAASDLQTKRSQRTTEDKNLREKIFELEMARLRYQDSAYREVWSRDYACAIFLNHQKWQNLFTKSDEDYTSYSATWRTREDAARDMNKSKIDAQQAAHDSQMKDDEEAQRLARSQWLTSFQSSLQDEDNKRQQDTDKRDTEVMRILIMATVRLRLQEMFTNNAEATHSSISSSRALSGVDVRRERALSESQFQRMLSASAEESAQLLELKLRVASSLEKTLQLDPATSMVQVTKVTKVNSKSSSDYDVEYEIRMASQNDAKRVAPAIGGSGKAIFQRILKGNLEMEIADADKKDSTVLSRMRVGDVKSDAGSLRVSQKSVSANKNSPSASNWKSSSLAASGSRTKSTPFAAAGAAILMLVAAVYLFA